MRAIEYSADEIMMTGYLADGSSGSQAPGILVAHEGPGMNDHIKARTQALAELGYIAFALDLYGEANFPLETVRSRHAELMNTPGAILRRATAALKVLSVSANVDPARLAAIGFCQGGMTVMELARGGTPIRCAVGFHPGLKRPAGSLNGPISAKVLMMVGDSDPVIPIEDRNEFAREMNEAKADWQMHLFGGVGHSFTNPGVDALNIPGIAYNADADRRSWALMLSLFDEVFR
jgi:dienelactone hydrolase